MQHQSEFYSMLEYVNKGWPILVCVIGFVAWLLRLEAKVVYAERLSLEKDKATEIKNKASDQKDKDQSKALNDIQKDIRDILQNTAKIEGKLEVYNNKNQ